MSRIKVHVKGRQRGEFKIWRLIWIKIQVLPTGTRCIVAKASTLEKPRTWVRNLASVRFSFVRCVLSSVLPLRSVGMSNFDKGLHSLTTFIQKRHILMRTAVLYNGINSGQIWRKKKHKIYIYIYLWIYSSTLTMLFVLYIHHHYYIKYFNLYHC